MKPPTVRKIGVFVKIEVFAQKNLMFALNTTFPCVAVMAVLIPIAVMPQQLG
jgi:hypothetical protein